MILFCFFSSRCDKSAEIIRWQRGHRFNSLPARQPNVTEMSWSGVSTPILIVTITTWTLHTVHKLTAPSAFSPQSDLFASGLFERVSAPFFPQCTSVSLRLFVSLPLQRSVFSSEEKKQQKWEERTVWGLVIVPKICVLIYGSLLSHSSRTQNLSQVMSRIFLK